MQKTHAIAAALCCAIVANASLISLVSANYTECFSWYTVPSKNGMQPDSFEARNIIDKYDTIYLGNPDDKKVYLTFDAGYENGNVKKIVDVLKKHEIKGAFFVLPHFITSNPELISQMTEDGHLICNHSASHRDMSKITDKTEFENELKQLEEVYRKQTGHEMAKYYRPPEGRFSESNLSNATELGYKTVFWSLAYADWDNNKQMTPEKAKELILSRIHNGCVLLLHPTSQTNAAIMDDLICELKRLGYSFGTLDEFE